jgi:hypothetical protein
MPANLPVLYTTINLAGATSSIDIGIPYIYYIYESAGGNLSGNYTIQASATPTIDTIINIKKKGNISLNGNTFSVFGVSLTEEQANKELSITAIYNFTSSSWDIFIDIDTSQLPSIYEGVESTAVPTSGTTTLLPNIDRKWQVFTGSQTLVGNYTITGTGSQNGQEFWIIWNSTLDLNGNTLSIFGLTIPEGDAIGGNFIVVAKYDGSAWVAKFIDGHFGLWEEGSGLKSVKKLGSTSTASGDYSTDFGDANTNGGDYSVTAGRNNTTSDAYTEATGDGNTTSAAGSIAKGLNNTASGIYSLAVGDTNVASGAESVAIGLNNTSSASQSIAFGNQCTASAARALATGYISYAERAGQKAHSSGRQSSTSGTYAQESVVQCLVITTDATKTTLLLNGSTGLITIPANTVANCYVKVTGVQQGGGSGSVGTVATFNAWVTIKNIGGTTALVDSPLYMDNTGAISTTSASSAQDAAAATWALDITPDNTNDALLVQVTGEASKTIYWHATVYIDEIKYA